MRIKKEIMASLAKNPTNFVGFPELIEVLIDLRDEIRRTNDLMHTSNSLRIRDAH